MTLARAAWLAFAQSMSMTIVLADAPTLEVIYPPGAGIGSTNTITVSGKFEPWPPQVWVSAPGLAFEAQTNKGRFSVAVSANAEPGPRLVRLYNDDGASEPRFFVVGSSPDIQDTEPNDHFARAQTISELPATINGRLDKTGDTDSFAVPLRAGQWLDARVDSHTLMSKLDAVLRLVTTNGRQLAWNHDFATFDPRITWRATNDQTVVVQIYGFPYPATAAVKLYGGESAIYRLHLSASTEFRLQPAAQSPDRNTSSRLQPELHSSNDTLQPPASVQAVITNTEQRHAFTANKDELLSLKVAAAISGSPLDAFLKIEDAAGTELARNDDAEGTRDPALEWKAPANGTFNAVIGSLTHRGGPDYHYCLSLDRALPDFRASLSASSLVVKPDSTNSLKFHVKRLRGHTNQLVANFKNLPHGVTALSTNVPDKGGDVNLQLIVATNAPAFSGPVRLVLTDTIAATERVIAFPLTSRTEDNGVPGGYASLLIDAIDHLWLTVRSAPVEAAKEK